MTADTSPRTPATEDGRSLAERHDVLLLDLDGTVYLGGQVIEHAPEALDRAARAGSHPMYVTNNASRSPADVAASLTGMGIAATAEDVLTSPQAAATMLAETHPAGAKVLVVGAPFLADSVAAVGLTPVRLVADEPVAVVQGHSPDTGWRNLAEACIALRAGADWVACNVDSTLPTDRGLLPGNGAMVQALMAATGLRPRVAGKPARPLLDEAVRRVDGSRPLVVGDRLDTDIEAGVAAGMPSLLVLTGVCTAAGLLAAGPAQRPSSVALDLRGLLDPDRAVALDGAAPADGWAVTLDGSTLVLDRGDREPHPDPDVDALRALGALTVAAWESGATAVRAGSSAAEPVLRRWDLD
ncbi:HAD-IIA family hydrolase [Nakamurella endophytica]|uniref:D,L-glycerol 3-phosphate phosphatase n=1 Tax=Nakamurella endophytica TaxID=1748367 RepID=A0A917T7B3_9ACTN|nr:HAD-IIA family hydrolase [Nakamurella endophytica]GGM13465.1 D,L-glycerol 3-phosphate phosphatase [Nakamurella endophytica]